MAVKAVIKTIFIAAVVVSTTAVFVGLFYLQPRETQLQKQGALEVFESYKFTLADTEEKRVKGLSGQGYLEEDAVLLFVYEKDNDCSIWMKDMRFSIDVVWLDENFRVIDLAQELSPDTFPKIFSSTVPCRNFIEANAGFVEAKGIHRGSRASINFADFTLSF